MAPSANSLSVVQCTLYAFNIPCSSSFNWKSHAMNYTKLRLLIDMLHIARPCEVELTYFIVVDNLGGVSFEQI